MKTWIPALVLLGWVVLALGDWVFVLEPNRVDLEKILAAPDADSWLGNDDLGRPILDRMIVGARVSLVVGVVGSDDFLAGGNRRWGHECLVGRMGRPTLSFV